MKKFRKKPIVIEAEQWFKIGDVPEAPITPNEGESADGSDWVCSECNHFGSEHGYCKTLEGYHIVCPGDWIIKGIKGEFYPCKPYIFKATYESVDSYNEAITRVVNFDALLQIVCDEENQPHQFVNNKELIKKIFVI